MAERRTREPGQAADLSPVVADGDEELRGLGERLDDERSRQEGVAGEVVGEDVLGRAHVLQRLDPVARLDGDEAVDEDEAHCVRAQAPGASRAADASRFTI